MKKNKILKILTVILLTNTVQLILPDVLLSKAEAKVTVLSIDDYPSERRWSLRDNNWYYILSDGENLCIGKREKGKGVSGDTWYSIDNNGEFTYLGKTEDMWETNDLGIRYLNKENTLIYIHTNKQGWYYINSGTYYLYDGQLYEIGLEEYCKVINSTGKPTFIDEVEKKKEQEKIKKKENERKVEEEIQEEAKKTGKWKEIDNYWYFVDSKEKPLNGWIKYNNNWYYTLSDGKMAHNTWVESNNKWYYFGQDGIMLTNAVVGEYKLGNDGAWIIEQKGSLTGDDVKGSNIFKYTYAQSQRDMDMSDSLSYCNIDLSNHNDSMLMELLVYYLEEGRLELDEAKRRCIGKVLQDKYMITDIKMFKQEFKYQDYIGNGSKKNIVERKSNVLNYKSNAKYVYDRCEILSNTASEWATVRVVVEFQEV